jgi:hypothetical protein
MGGSSSLHFRLCHPPDTGRRRFVTSDGSQSSLSVAKLRDASDVTDVGRLLVAHVT